MSIEEQIKIVKELIEEVKDLNREYSTGASKEINNGERLLEFLSGKLKEN